MRFAYLRSAGLVSVGIVLGAAAATAGSPVWRGAIMRMHQQRYAELTFKCDTAMRDHMIAKQEAELRPSREAGRTLEAAELALLDCQDYDLYQKRLMRWGLREDDLAEMRLEAIEQRGPDLSSVVETHEIRY